MNALKKSIFMEGFLPNNIIVGIGNKWKLVGDFSFVLEYKTAPYVGLP